jgi:hypothetical protein
VLGRFQDFGINDMKTAVCHWKEEALQCEVHIVGLADE